MPYKKAFKKVVIYYKAGKLLHLIALISLTIFVYTFIYTFIFIEHKMVFLAILYGYSAYLTFGIFIFAQLDARSRFQNFKQLRDQLYKFGFSERLIRPLRNSRCQRDAVIVACEFFGLNDTVKEYFFKHGYRWYHIFPDFVFSHPGFLLTGTFWTTTFFVKTYKPIYSFE